MSIQDDIRHFIAKNYGADPSVADDASLIDRGVIDSTAGREVVAHLTSAYGIQISEAEITRDNLDSIARIAAFVEKKRSDAPKTLQISEDAVKEVEVSESEEGADAAKDAADIAFTPDPHA